MISYSQKSFMVAVLGSALLAFAPCAHADDNDYATCRANAAAAQKEATAAKTAANNAQVAADKLDAQCQAAIAKDPTNISCKADVVVARDNAKIAVTNANTLQKTADAAAKKCATTCKAKVNLAKKAYNTAASSARKAQNKATSSGNKCQSAHTAIDNATQRYNDKLASLNVKKQGYQDDWDRRKHSFDCLWGLVSCKGLGVIEAKIRSVNSQITKLTARYNIQNTALINKATAQCLTATTDASNATALNVVATQKEAELENIQNQCSAS